MLKCTFEPLINMLMHFTLIRYPSHYCHAKIEEIYQKYFHYSLKLFRGLYEGCVGLIKKQYFSAKSPLDVLIQFKLQITKPRH